MRLNARPELYRDGDVTMLSFYDHEKEYGFSLSKSEKMKGVEVMYRDQDLFSLDHASFTLSNDLLVAKFDFEGIKETSISLENGEIQYRDLIEILREILSGCNNVSFSYES